MSDIAPDSSPFGAESFARFWDGWKGRTCARLDVPGLESHYVRRSVGPLSARAAMPYGLPVFRDDYTAERTAWVRAFFNKGGTLRASLSLYCAPRHVYPGVAWTAQERRVVVLDDEWKNRLDPAILRRSRRAAEARWAVRELAPAEVRRSDQAVAETDRRHNIPSGFSADFCARLLERVRGDVEVRILGAVRGEEIGAFQVIVARHDYEVGWFLCSTDVARRESVGPLLTSSWIEQSVGAGCRYIDLGASPTPGVAAFKDSFGAQRAYLYTGVRGLHLFGS